MQHNFVISMPSAEKRRTHIVQQFNAQNISFQFFDACTPSNDLFDYLKSHLPNVLATNNLTAGEKGCLTSHFMLWKKCVDENLDYITIFEDDILLGENANQYLENSNWLKERLNFDESFVLRLETFLIPVEIEHQVHISPFLGRKIDRLKSKHFGTAGYIISHAAAKYLISLFQNIPENEIKPIDEVMFNHLVESSQTPYIVYQLNPAICVQELQLNQEKSMLKSDLQKDRKMRTKKEERKNKTLKQKLFRIKDNMMRALNKKKWIEQNSKENKSSGNIIPFL